MRALEGDRDLFDLAARLLGAEVNGGADRHRAHVERLLDAGVQGLVVLGRVAQRFVVVEFDQERNFMRVAARYRRQHAVGGSDAVTAGFNRQLDDVLRIEIQRVGGERGGGGVLDALIDRQDRQVAGAGQAAVVEQGLHRTQHAVGTVVIDHYAVNEVVARQVEILGGDSGTAVLQQIFRFLS